MKMYPTIALCVIASLSGCGGDAGDGGNFAPASPVSHWKRIDQMTGQMVTGSGIAGTLSPNDLMTHYNMPPQYTGAGQTIVIVDAAGSADVASDLNAFSSYYGLPQCNATNGCFQQINLSSAPAASSNDWDMEIGLDVEWAHAMAPAAKIVLIEAASANVADLFKALQASVAQPNVAAVSMSWGAPEYASETRSNYDGFFKQHPGVAFFAAAGDTGNDGSNQIYPAASPYVTAVGGTTIASLVLPQTSTSEIAWSQGGGGASIYETMPAFQSAYLKATHSSALKLNKGKRGIPDVAYNADPSASPVAVYVKGGWYAIGGTSEGAPQWSAIVARLGQYLNGKGSSVSGLLTPNNGFNGVIYQTRLNQASNSGFYNVTVGSNDTSGKPCALCTAGPGYDDVTGLGVPNVGNLLGSF
ncbi:peptidase S8/S53 subtilisin kexin sedolisin [Paraburkholderia sp. UYCP14C]|uniref:S53 family peptidase n=1 Tax=Paraburkholderia sp. UYCP14C TaxID=2511130 RepID=UPI00102120EA|nr:S53 family peptidase [Paraburkholderia sp. UYCP14C]RZF27277.1 peptidase S8/S53 subtilisin kexin sedolisin [Paraburkholderia sp. UYCP14C]